VPKIAENISQNLPWCLCQNLEPHFFFFTFFLLLFCCLLPHPLHHNSWSSAPFDLSFVLLESFFVNSSIHFFSRKFVGFFFCFITEYIVSVLGFSNKGALSPPPHHCFPLSCLPYFIYFVVAPRIYQTILLSVNVIHCFLNFCFFFCFFFFFLWFMDPAHVLYFGVF